MWGGSVVVFFLSGSVFGMRWGKRVHGESNLVSEHAFLLSGVGFFPMKIVDENHAQVMF